MSFTNILRYKATVSIFRKWQADALITREEFLKLDAMMAKKHGLSPCSIYRYNYLINGNTRANMDEETY